MANIGLVSYAIGAGLFLVLTALLASAWRGRVRGALLLVACAISTIWCATLAYHAYFQSPSFEVVEALEIGRDGAWLAFLIGILSYGSGEGKNLKLRLIGRLVLALCAAAIAFLLIQPLMEGWMETFSSAGRLLFLHLLLAVAGLMLVEQLYRNTRPEHRWAIKFLCLGVGALFAYDFYLYSDALLFKRISRDLWDARGAVNAILVPLIAVSVARNPQWSVEIFVSRHIVFHSAAVLGAGIYLMLMAAAGYYIRIYGGTWGSVVQTVFLFGAVILLFALFSSGQLRARAKVFFSKHFFKNKYDYREEWLRFTRTLSMSRDDGELRQNIVRGIAEIVESPGGVMWVKSTGGTLAPVASWNITSPENGVIARHDPLVHFIEHRGWVIYLDEMRREPERYDDLVLPQSIVETPNAWLIAPLMLRGEVLGFVLLLRSNTKMNLNWEDTDLLKTVGREAASYLAVLRLTEALTDARQFEAFNRLSAFVVHDLKNIVAQLSLVVKNGKRLGNNAMFSKDAIKTVENATGRMNRLLEHFRKKRVDTIGKRDLLLEDILRQVVNSRSVTQPVPRLESENSQITVRADPDRLGAVIEHLIQNAQDATPQDGHVVVRLRGEDDWAVIEIEDDGEGMESRFVTERLFRPFDTTKGNAGMGIGAYESREFVREHGGDIEVESCSGRGSTFRIRLPAVRGAVVVTVAETGVGAAN